MNSLEIPSADGAGGDGRRELSLRNRVVTVQAPISTDEVLGATEIDRHSNRSSRKSGCSSSGTGSTLRRRDVEQLRLEFQREDAEARERFLQEWEASEAVRQVERERRLLALERVASNGKYLKKNVRKLGLELRRSLRFAYEFQQDVSRRLGDDNGDWKDGGRRWDGPTDEARVRNRRERPCNEKRVETPPH
ncbi:hypothetical protein GE061_005775 [Apolygus lucorum]|uniref:Uncharacterized protein n=1 Tax=Apolygus lucorum TaxID=248454 RepID=A0A8S9WX78_APOLU|nr:hypothetical protein GE061_005775 [Apolygus lucorum]